MHDWCFNPLARNFRYSVTRDLGQSHHVLGKISCLSSLPANYLATVLRKFSIQQSSAILYHRAIIEGTVYTTTSYVRSKVKTDCVLCFKCSGSRFFGISKHCTSFCTTDCSACLKPCKHIFFTTLLQRRRDHGSTALRGTHVHPFFSTRFGCL